MRFYGKIGFITTVEETDDLGNGTDNWIESSVEKDYYGEILRFGGRRSNNGNIIDDFGITNSISIFADPFLNENLESIRYIVWMGSKWKITDVTVDYPRLTLSIGGLYHGPDA